jgi:serine/threonine protein kinase
MSPEQAQGKTKEIDQRSDIFSFGCILFEAATGKKPFEGESVIKSLHMVVYEPAPRSPISTHLRRQSCNESCGGVSRRTLRSGINRSRKLRSS